MTTTVTYVVDCVLHYFSVNPPAEWRALGLLSPTRALEGAYSPASLPTCRLPVVLRQVSHSQLET